MSSENRRYYDDVMTAATPNVRQNKASRFARRSVHMTSLQDSSLLLEETPATNVFQVSRTPKIRTHITDSTPAIRTDSPFQSFGDTCLNTSNKPEFVLDDSFNMAAEEHIHSVRMSLYDEFFQLYSQNPIEQNAFDLMIGYEQCCSKMVKLLEQHLSKSALKPSANIVEFTTSLRLERNTWRLMRILLMDSLHSLDDQNMLDSSNQQGVRLSDKAIIDHFFERDTVVRQTQLVADWLEKNLAEDIDVVKMTKSHYFMDSKTAWESTRHTLEKTTRENRWVARPLISELDPDAPLREKRPIHDLDKADEDEITRFLFALISAGKLDEAEKVAERHGYLWLSAAMEGWRPYHDPNYNMENMQEGHVLHPAQGNQFRDVWKATTWNIISQESLPRYENGILSALSGHLTGLLHCCESWEDHFWAYVKVLIDHQVDQEIRSATQLERPLIQLPPTNWKMPRSMEEILQALESSPKETVQKSCLEPQHIVQKHIVLHEMEALLDVMNSWAQSSKTTVHSSPEMLRFMSHFGLLMSLSTQGDGLNLTSHSHLITSYVSLLIEEDKKDLVASYTAHLLPSQQVFVYAKFLEGITERTEQHHCLEWAEASGLNVHLITKTLVRNIHSKPSSADDSQQNVLPSTDPQLYEPTTSEDKMKISALDWLTFDPAQCAEALKQGNALMRKFVIARKIEAVKQTMSKLPSDAVHVITRHWKNLTKSDDLPAEEANSTREYLCFQTYLQALESFNDWFSHFHVSCPSEPAKPKGDQATTLAFTDWVNYEHKLKQYQADLERWKQTLKHQTQITIDHLYNVLLFPDGGFMVDSHTVEEYQDEYEAIEFESRSRSMALLRRLVIPQVCALLHTLFSDSQMYREHILLADVIADHKNDLYLEFRKDELQDFLLKIRESSLALLDQNLDPFGFPFQ